MNKYSVHKQLLKTSGIEDKKVSKNGYYDGIEHIPFGYFNSRTARGKRWTWEKMQLKNANRKIRYSNKINIQNIENQ